jgi:transcriptional regulator with XRE-family HTH domain
MMAKELALNEYRATQAVLRSRRQALGLTQFAVSARMGRAQRFVAGLERTNTKRVPAFTTIVEWAAALGLEIRWEAPDAGQE